MITEHKGRGPAGKRAGGGGKLSRSEIVTVRLDPKLRYLTELAARRQRRTVSSFIEWVIEEGLKRVFLTVEAGDNVNTSVAGQASRLWDVDEPDRFVKLALSWPELLTHEEQVLWKLIRENGYLWRGNYPAVTHEWSWTTDERSMRFERLREHWEIFCAVAKGNAAKSALPTWDKRDSDRI
ncbi:hypothetical protein G5V57_18325 [Nordella sp. HKS 07]|uniref:hypothetical protein n=1 Tax=Nordella sp. HKS 07 TaxID=2712222 RepID=UPI0013E1D39D|nr:hypothetical protein [Nordella sp. HKS 07]QIG49492.1 hypothetical protein G5V57_18325 [Nordella sp. HKS 07]